MKFINKKINGIKNDCQESNLDEDLINRIDGLEKNIQNCEKLYENQNKILKEEMKVLKKKISKVLPENELKEELKSERKVLYYFLYATKFLKFH